MCRLAAYVGPELPLAALLYDPPHSLERQSYAARELLWGNVNVDGTGVAWWDDGDEPLRYVTTEPPWKDANLPHLAPRIRSHAMLAAVRSATPGIPQGAPYVAPFTVGRLAGVHNGWIQAFRGPVGRELTQRLPDELYAAMDVASDSKALILTIAGHYDGDLAEAVRRGVHDVEEIVRRHDVPATLNVVVADGSTVVATRHSVGVGVNSLYVAARDRAHWLASEPLDDADDWKPIPESHVVVMTARRLAVTPLDV
jgi:glutamine amidotransferase